MQKPENPGPAWWHEELVPGGASQAQVDLLGGGHHPRCHHYEWGPCTCSRLFEEDPLPVTRSSSNPEACPSVEKYGDHLEIKTYSRPLRRFFRKTVYLRCWTCDMKVPV